VVEAKPYPSERIPILRTAVRGKKRRVVDALRAGGTGTEYLHLSEDRCEAVMADGRGDA
jgi:hypothetical protein